MAQKRSTRKSSRAAGENRPPDRADDLAPPDPTKTEPEPPGIASPASGAQPDMADTVRAGARRGRFELVADIMTLPVEVVTPETELQYVARIMADRGCGAVPVVEDTDTMRLVGIITDRDLVVRIIAKGQDPYALHAADCMSTDLLTVKPETNLDECLGLMEARQVRRAPVVDSAGRCIGIIAQADIAAYAPPEEAAEFLKEISQPGVSQPEIPVE